MESTHSKKLFPSSTNAFIDSYENCSVVREMFALDVLDVFAILVVDSNQKFKLAQIAQGSITR